MLDIGFVEIVAVHLAAHRRIIDFLLDHGVDLELGADLADDLLLGGGAARIFELFEQFLHFAMVLREELESVLRLVFAGH